MSKKIMVCKLETYLCYQHYTGCIFSIFSEHGECRGRFFTWETCIRQKFRIRFSPHLELFDFIEEFRISDLETSENISRNAKKHVSSLFSDITPFASFN
jgi:hypothetical protein